MTKYRKNVKKGRSIFEYQRQVYSDLIISIFSHYKSIVEPGNPEHFLGNAMVKVAKHDIQWLYGSRTPLCPSYDASSP